MNIKDSAEESRFREEVRDWVHQNRPVERRPAPSDLAACRAYDTAWQAVLHDAGFAGISWPKEYGGQGLSLGRQLIWYEEYAKADMPPGGHESVCFVGLAHAGPTLILCGSDDHKAAHLPKILAGQTVWCQGFSEPSAGSDLGSLRTRAVLDGDALVVTGQKVWTSYANVADFQELLVRTDPDAQKHKGLSWVICDMTSPGITVRPIRNMAGHAEFCEVFYDEVRIPLGNVVGGLNNGWKTAMSTLSFERGTAFISDQVTLAAEVERLEEVTRQVVLSGAKRAIDHDGLRDRLAALKAEVRALRAMTYLSVSRNERRAQPGADGSMVRLFYGELSQRVSAYAIDLLGSGALQRDGAHAEWVVGYLHRYAATIGAGTSQIQRSIIGERVLGLPRSR